MAGGRRGRGVGAVDDDAGSSKQEVVQQLLDQRRACRESLLNHTLIFSLPETPQPPPPVSGELHSLTQVLLLAAAQRQECFDQAQVSGQEDVVRLAGLHLGGPTGLKVVQPGDLVLQHGGRAYFDHLHLGGCRKRQQNVGFGKVLSLSSLKFGLVFKKTNKQTKNSVHSLVRSSRSWHLRSKYSVH